MQDMEKALIEAATKVREWAHAPYSKYRVGAAIMNRAGEVFTGCNVENASYGLSICAERSAVCKMIAEGSNREIALVSVVTADGGSPCGACRQVLAEFGDDFEVLSFAADQQTVQRWSVAALLPDAFRLRD